MENKIMALSIKPKEKKDPLVRMNFGIKTSVKNDMALYCQAYQETYEDELTEGELLNQVLADFFAKDKGFQTYKLNQKKADAKPEEKSATAAKQPEKNIKNIDN
jgi:hypothetical protein